MLLWTKVKEKKANEIDFAISALKKTEIKRMEAL